jgi:SAM-dependent methyltransferase
VPPIGVYDRFVQSRVEREAAPNTERLGLIAALRDALRAAEFTVERAEAELGTHELTGRSTDRIVYRRRLRDKGSFGALARLFLLGDEVKRSELESALGALGVQGLALLGLCDVNGSAVRATVMLIPHGDYYIACDSTAPVGVDTPFDYVPGVQAPSVTLAKLAVRSRAGSALDLGTGSGLQALLAAKHSRSVVATDVNQRALTFARFNARLNDLSNIEFRHGATFEPVVGEQFDLIVSNPPYVISPEYRYSYRDSDIPGDELCRQIVEEVPSHLKEAGFAHVLVSWTHPAGGDWHAPLREWVSGSGCDAWLLRYRTADPLDHAGGWLRPIGERDPVAFRTGLDSWLAYLRDRGIEAVSYGAIVLRRRQAGRNWVRTQDLPSEGLDSASEQTLRVFAGNDLLSELDEKALLEERLRLTPQHRLRQELGVSDGSFQVRQVMLDLTDGLCLTVGLDRYTMLLLPHLDGRRSLARALEDAAAGSELTDEAQQQYVPAALPVIRRLLELGFLELGSLER